LHARLRAHRARHSLRLLISEGGIFQQKFAWMRGEIAKLWLTSPRLRGEVGDGA
jgi:hypothetical protein